MTQEVQVTLTLEVDITQQKEDIEKFIRGLITSHIYLSSTYNRMVFNFMDSIIIKEESEIYQNE